MFNGITILDSHMHYSQPIREESLIDVLDETGVDYALLAALPNISGHDPTADILMLKAHHPSRIFAFGCLSRMDYYHSHQTLSQRLIARVTQLLSAGCDGLKLLEGKPTMRREHPIPDFDNAVWDPFWTYAEETGLPILWHVNDPETFWDAKKASAHAIEEGWVYGPDIIKNEEQFRQVKEVLNRHRKLNICFAHFLFLAAQLPRLTEWMESFPNMRLDLTPGIEIYEELSQKPDESHAFLTRFHDRILYGTDSGGRAALSRAHEINRKEIARRAEIVRAFLTQTGARTIRSDGDYLVGVKPFVMQCLGLKREILTSIFHTNFLHFIGRSAPAPVHMQEVQHLRTVLSK